MISNNTNIFSISVACFLEGSLLNSPNIWNACTILDLNTILDFFPTNQNQLFVFHNFAPPPHPGHLCCIKLDSVFFHMAIEDPVYEAEDLECPLCYHFFCEPVLTPCNHLYCKNCLSKALRIFPPRCPICRGAWWGNQLQPLARWCFCVSAAVRILPQTFRSPKTWWRQSGCLTPTTTPE